MNKVFQQYPLLAPFAAFAATMVLWAAIYLAIGLSSGPGAASANERVTREDLATLDMVDYADVR